MLITSFFRVLTSAVDCYSSTPIASPKAQRRWHPDGRGQCGAWQIGAGSGQGKDATLGRRVQLLGAHGLEPVWASL
ncbi:MAG TPA: hypothetical protein VN520_37640, partial [Streptomyces sp.]|uniref:hypothetical protein n=1 Tax=Streptomyces sp. TaxID=1931 RepID=UPI002B551618